MQAEARADQAAILDQLRDRLDHMEGPSVEYGIHAPRPQMCF
jgi:hypothetical protein